MNDILSYALVYLTIGVILMLTDITLTVYRDGRPVNRSKQGYQALIQYSLLFVFLWPLLVESVLKNIVRS